MQLKNTVLISVSPCENSLMAKEKEWRFKYSVNVKGNINEVKTAFNICITDKRQV